jgi:uncharacterized protein
MNRLASEKSPYLLQHAENPVEWYPWGDEAFQKAKEEDKPIFLSIGYATCHWCHVMAHESFEDNRIAGLMNQAFVNVKVDREERPDIDNTYMTVCQMLTGQGGWPLTILMTPDKEPFFAATYLPKQSRQGRIGMLELVPRIVHSWTRDRNRIQHSVQKIKEGFGLSLELGQSDTPLQEDILAQAYHNLSDRYDEEHGGFGGSPKFPSPHNLLFLFDYSRIEDEGHAAAMAKETLTAMRLGGLWDHVGGGFHRYSTDSEWLLPHFEKMLYDQAMMLWAYSEGWKQTGNPLFKETAEQIADYLDECLTAPGGLFYSAEDADSEGVEGKFYVWQSGEIKELFGSEDGNRFIELFNFTDEGNFIDEATHRRTGNNIVHLKAPLPQTVKSEADQWLKLLKKKRQKRVRPFMDDKILTDWNALTIASLARSGVLLNRPGWIARAESAWNELEKNLLGPDSTLLHMLKDGEASVDGMADDYVFSILALLNLYDATFSPVYLQKAIRLQETFQRLFEDSDHGGYYFTPVTGEKLMGRQKEIYDGALPSSNSVAALNGYRLARLTGNTLYEEKCEQTFRAFSEQISDAPAGYTFALYSLQRVQSRSYEIVICSESDDPKTRDLIELCRNEALPGSVILLKTDKYEESLSDAAPFSASYPIGKSPSVYLCRDFTCRAPLFDPGEIRQALSEN